MPSVSDKQVRFFRLVKAYKSGEITDVSQSVKDAADGMTMSQINDYLVKESMDTKYKLKKSHAYINSVGDRDILPSDTEFTKISDNGNMVKLQVEWDDKIKTIMISTKTYNDMIKNSIKLESTDIVDKMIESRLDLKDGSYRSSDSDIVYYVSDGKVVKVDPYATDPESKYSAIDDFDTEKYTWFEPLNNQAKDIVMKHQDSVSTTAVDKMIDRVVSGDKVEDVIPDWDMMEAVTDLPDDMQKYIDSTSFNTYTKDKLSRMISKFKPFGKLPSVGMTKDYIERLIKIRDNSNLKKEYNSLDDPNYKPSDAMNAILDSKYVIDSYNYDYFTELGNIILR